VLASPIVLERDGTRSFASFMPVFRTSALSAWLSRLFIYRNRLIPSKAAFL